MELKQQKMIKKLIYEIIQNKKGNQIKFKNAKFNDKKLFEIKIDDYNP